MDPWPEREPEINKLFRLARKHKASDLYLRVGLAPLLRFGDVIRQTEMRPFSQQDLEHLLLPILYAEQQERLGHGEEVAFTYVYEEGDAYLVSVSKMSNKLRLSAHWLDVAGEHQKGSSD
jgi:Tfp pilus assembly pilus retraction ATPase PilT